MDTHFFTTAVDSINASVRELDAIQRSQISDGDHSFAQLYAMRAALLSALLSEWAYAGKYSTYKSLRHNDGQLCFGGGWFIAGASLPSGAISFHFPISDWNRIHVPERSVGQVWDGHTESDVMARLYSTAELLRTNE